MSILILIIYEIGQLISKLKEKYADSPAYNFQEELS